MQIAGKTGKIALFSIIFRVSFPAIFKRSLTLSSSSINAYIITFSSISRVPLPLELKIFT